MADDADPEQFEILLSSIKRHFEREEFDRSLKLCAKAIEARPDLDVGLRCRIFALLNLSRWSEALEECTKAKGVDAEVVAFERAYCLYRLNRFQEAIDFLEASQKVREADEDEERWQRLEAQVRYRMGDYAICAKTYSQLFEDNSEDIGLLVNAVASGVSGGEARQAAHMLGSQEELLQNSYELCFNLACALLDEGKLDEAEGQLDAAKRICINELVEAEELTADDVVAQEAHEEIAAIQVQKGVVLHRRGLTTEAASVYNTVLRRRLTKSQEADITVLAVAANNVVAISPKRKSMLDSLKRFSTGSKEPLEHKLTRRQSLEMSTNKCALFIQSRKVDEARREVQKLSEGFPGHPRVVIIQAALAQLEKKSKGEEVLQTYAADHPDCMDVLFCLAQIYCETKRLDKAAEVFSKLPARSRATPSTVEAIAAVHIRMKSPDKALACVQDAVDYWKAQDGDDRDEETFAAVLRLAIKLAEQLGGKELLAEAYQLLLEHIDGSDVEALCGLVSVLASTDLERAEQYAERMQVPDYDHLDAEELELGAIPKVGLSSKRVAQDGEAAEGKVVTKKRRGRKGRKPRFPKGFDPKNPGPPPDPERWLPKWQRTETLKKMRKRDKTLFRGPQGAMPVDDNAFRKTGPSTAQVEAARDNTTRRNQGRKKGKK